MSGLTSLLRAARTSSLIRRPVMLKRLVPFVSLVGIGMAAVGILLGVAGCGGNNAGTKLASTASGTGRATLTVRWPERSRLIPFAAESIRIRLTRGEKLLGET